jgi:hypothetical protein
MKKEDAGQLYREEIARGGATIRTRLLDRGCGVMTSPKPAHETIPTGRHQIGMVAAIRLE